MVRQRRTLAVLFHHRWSVPILAELYRRQGERYAYLAHRFGISRETLSQTLEYLVTMGWVRRNPGYGHPLRPEYLLTSKGEDLGLHCVRLDDALREQEHVDVGLRKWTFPLLQAIAVSGEPGRFSKLLDAIQELTPRALSDALKRMEEAGLIVREVTSGFPPSTRYLLTRSGKRYMRIIESLAKIV